MASLARQRPRRVYAGVRKALSLAAEQFEENELKKAIMLCEKYERKLAILENRKQVQKLLPAKRGRASKSRNRRPQHLQTQKLKTIERKKKPREKVKHLTADLVHLIQRSLRRCHLRKGAKATFSARMTRSDFLRLFGGHVEIKEHENGKLFALFHAVDTPSLNAQLRPMLGISEQDNDWFCRRYCGEEVSETRDCSYIKCSEHESRNEMLFIWSQEKTAHLDGQGRLRSTSMGKLRCRFPRGVTTVRPSKRFRRR
mmetsp:Transcript_18101/g.27150  ORF Transcript_18101/g.27150 Transcript_18101/m.27150 type:complete len:256 (+) Transcript_18101:3-770(+)